MKGESPHFTPLQQRILGYLTLREVTDGTVCCTKKEISEAMSCSAKTVDRAIVRLRDEGVIEVVPQYLESGGQVGNTYRIVH